MQFTMFGRAKRLAFEASGEADLGAAVSAQFSQNLSPEG
jgi:hypothetical protein